MFIWRSNYITKRELDERLLFFNPEIVFDGTPGGVKLLMEVDAFNGHVNWSVQEGDIILILWILKKQRLLFKSNREMIEWIEMSC